MVQKYAFDHSPKPPVNHRFIIINIKLILIMNICSINYKIHEVQKNFYLCRFSPANCEL